MITWVEHHGFECLIAAYIFSVETSLMPPLPIGKGWWLTWLYNSLQVFGANAGSLVKHSPVGKQIETALGKSTEPLPGGGVKTTEVATQKTTEV